MPGFGGELRLELGDITGGQVRLGITGGPEPLVTVAEARSVREADVVAFSWNDEHHYLGVIRLENSLFAEDFGEFWISTNRADVVQTLLPEERSTALERPGLPNLHRVSPDLYRGAQPRAAGFAELRRLGVGTVVNLRSFHEDEVAARAAGLDYVRIPMHAWDPNEVSVARFLRVLTDAERQRSGAVFVHCQHGADRTGVAVAAYRVAVQRWSIPKAIHEMRRGPFGFHRIWTNLVTFVRRLDVTALRRAAGLE